MGWQLESRLCLKLTALICKCSRQINCTFVRAQKWMYVHVFLWIWRRTANKYTRELSSFYQTQFFSFSLLQSSESRSRSHQVQHKANLKLLMDAFSLLLVFADIFDIFASAAHLVITTNMASTPSWFEVYRIRCMQGMEMFLPGVQRKALTGLGGRQGWLAGFRIGVPLPPGMPAFCW